MSMLPMVVWSAQVGPLLGRAAGRYLHLQVGDEVHGRRGLGVGQAAGRSKVTRRPSTPPGPTRPLTSADVMALTIQPLPRLIIQDLLQLVRGELAPDQTLAELNDPILKPLHTATLPRAPSPRVTPRW